MPVSCIVLKIKVESKSLRNYAGKNNLHFFVGLDCFVDMDIHVKVVFISELLYGRQLVLILPVGMYFILNMTLIRDREEGGRAPTFSTKHRHGELVEIRPGFAPWQPFGMDVAGKDFGMYLKGESDSFKNILQ